MSDPDRVDQPPRVASSRHQGVEELVRAKGAKPIRSIEDLQTYSADLFESDEEVEEFLAFVRELRDVDLG